MALFLLLLLLGGNALGNRFVQVEHETIALADLPPAFGGFRIALLSDLHGASFGEGNASLLRAVAQEMPDCIALTGDLVDAHSRVAAIVPLIKGLLSIAPVYYVTGNHEWGSGQAREMVETLEALGAVCLQNEFLSLRRNGDELLIAGVHDPNGYADQKTPQALSEEILAARPQKPCWILLAHRNSRFAEEYSRLGAALVLSGHGHGGIWRLPLVGGLFGTDQQLFPAYAAGLYREEGGTALYVSRGLGNSPRYLPRLWNRPQVAILTLVGEKK